MKNGIVLIFLLMTVGIFSGCDILVANDTNSMDNGLPAPKNLIATVNVNSSNPSITLTWTPVSNATYYVIYRSTDDSTWTNYLCLNSSHTTTIYTDTSPALKGDTTYYYKVGTKERFASDPVGNLSEPVEVYVSSSEYNIITGFSASALSESGIRVTWSAVEGASKYRIYRAASYSEGLEAVSDVNATVTTYTDVSLAPNTTYYYRIAIIDSSGNEGPQSNNYVSATTTSGPIITGLSASALTEVDISIKLVWNAVKGASKYRIYRAFSASVYGEAIADVEAPATTYIDSSLAPNTTYYYRIAIIDSSGNEGSRSYNYYGATTASGPTIPGFSISILSESSLRIRWNAVEGVSKYRIYRALSYSGNGVAVADVDAPATSYTDTSLAPGTSYYYRIAIIDSNNNEGPQSGNYISAMTRALPAPAPDHLTATANGRIITLEWNPVEGASSYYIYGSFSETGPYAIIYNLNASIGTVYNVSSLSYMMGPALNGNTTYYFKVSTGGVMSNTVSATTGS